MSTSDMKDDKQMGNADKGQRDKDQKAGTDKQSGQRQQSTGGAASKQQGGQHDPSTQPGGTGADPNHVDPDRKGGKA